MTLIDDFCSGVGYLSQPISNPDPKYLYFSLSRSPLAQSQPGQIPVISRGTALPLSQLRMLMIDHPVLRVTRVFQAAKCIVLQKSGEGSKH